MPKLKPIKKNKLAESAETYEEFIIENRKRTNNSLNTVLWFFIIIGPAIALGIFAGIFPDVNYFTCIIISLILIFLSLIHKILCMKFPASFMTSFFALIALDFMILYISFSNINIYLTYFLVPFISLLFVDKKVYQLSCLINYAFVVVSVMFLSPASFAARTGGDDTSFIWLLNFLFGITIETFIMYIAGCSISFTTSRNLKNLYENQKQLKKNEKQMNEQLEILGSMSDIYSQINIIDFNKETIVSMNSSNKAIEKITFEKQHSEIDQQLSNQIIIDQTKSFLEFTNLATIQQRMKNQKFITAEFLNTTTGWFRVQYISLEQNDELIPVRLIHTIQDIDEEKQREENLKRISNTDQLTRLFNRRAYEDSIKKYETQIVENDFALFSIDVNGLKTVNDNLGHVAGDELLQGASFTMLAVLGHTGTVFRTGGDEFLITTHTTQDCEELKNQLIKIARNWHGNIVQELSLSIGYAKASDHPRASIHELEKIADANMYRDKELYYLSKGIDRRSQQKAFASICNSYTKILTINLSTDTYSIIKMNINEQKEDYGYSDQISTWLHTFGISGMVHPDDVDEYCKKTDLEYLRNFFEKDNKEFNIIYRRKTNDEYHKTLMQIIKPEEYSEKNPKLYLFVKDIDF